MFGEPALQPARMIRISSLGQSSRFLSMGDGEPTLTQNAREKKANWNVQSMPRRCSLGVHVEFLLLYVNPDKGAEAQKACQGRWPERTRACLLCWEPLLVGKRKPIARQPQAPRARGDPCPTPASCASVACTYPYCTSICTRACARTHAHVFIYIYIYRLI